MSTPFHCDDKETLVAYLYDEIDSDLRRQVTAHLRTCVACADEIESLRGVRRDLAEWQPPATELNFAIVQKPATVLRPTRWWQASAPAWARVAAAVLLFATGVALANVQVRYANGGITLTTGWMKPAPTEALPALVASPPADDWRPALTALESQLRREMQSLRGSNPASQPASMRASSAAVDSDALMRRVRQLVNESEQRQQQDLAIRMIEFGREMRTDLNRMNTGFRQLQGRTGAVEGNQRQMFDLMRRVATQQVP
jgi:hypothetical protein